MLDAYIIEQIKRRERERQRKEGQRPSVEIPAPDPEFERTEKIRPPAQPENVTRVDF